MPQFIHCHNQNGGKIYFNMCIILFQCLYTRFNGWLGMIPWDSMFNISHVPKPCFNIKAFFASYIPIIMIRWSWDHLIFIIRIPMLIRQHLYIKMASRFTNLNSYVSMTSWWIILCYAGTYINSLWPSNTIRRQGTLSTLAQVMACCLMAPSHYLNQCWLIISKVMWHSSEGIIMRRSEDTDQ